MRNHLFLALLFVAAAGRLPGQEAGMCPAPAPSSTGFGASAELAKMPRLAAMASLRDSLASEYRFVEFTTEGVEKREVMESRLTIRPRVPIDTARRIGYLGDIIAEGVGRIVRSGDAFGRLRVPKDTMPFHLAISYSPPDRLTLKHYHPEMADVLINDDPRPMYDVVDIDSAGTLSGRWVGGGIAMAVLKTAAGSVAEFPSGYFCAFPVRPARRP